MHSRVSQLMLSRTSHLSPLCELFLYERLFDQTFFARSCFYVLLFKIISCAKMKQQYLTSYYAGILQTPKFYAILMFLLLQGLQWLQVWLDAHHQHKMWVVFNFVVIQYHHALFVWGCSLAQAQFLPFWMLTWQTPPTVPAQPTAPQSALQTTPTPTSSTLPLPCPQGARLLLDGMCQCTKGFLGMGLCAWHAPKEELPSAEPRLQLSVISHLGMPRSRSSLPTLVLRKSCHLL